MKLPREYYQPIIFKQHMNNQIWPLLRKRYPSSGYAVLEEVRDAAGFSASRSADGVIMSLWPSRGLEVMGIEVKISRGDWLRELKNPKKAEAIFKYCDRWWLVTGDDTIAKKEEIPSTWGWMAVRGSRMVTMVEAPKLTPEPISRNFLATMLKRATQDMIHPADVENRIKESAETRSAQALRNFEREREEHNDLLKAVREFEQQSGLKISGSRYELISKNTGKVVKALLEARHHRVITALQNTADQYERLLGTIRAQLQTLSEYDGASCDITAQVEDSDNLK